MYLINLQGKESINDQIKSQIIKFVSLGVLKPDDKLPSVRMLAQDLGINPNTVAKAYQQLEAEGVIYTVNKKGVFVAGKEADKRQNYQAQMYIEDLKRSGFSKQAILEIVDSVFEKE